MDHVVLYFLMTWLQVKETEVKPASAGVQWQQRSVPENRKRPSGRESPPPKKPKAEELPLVDADEVCAIKHAVAAY